MHSEADSVSLMLKTKVREVILLTDNRVSHQQGPVPKDFRNSGFKETQVDPLQFPKNLMELGHGDDLIESLVRRVCDLQQRVRVLSQIKSVGGKSAVREKKKHRRRFGQLLRDHKCQGCGKVYGSETSLRHHKKVKHGKQQNDQ